MSPSDPINPATVSPFGTNPVALIARDAYRVGKCVQRCEKEPRNKQAPGPHYLNGAFLPSLKLALASGDIAAGTWDDASVGVAEIIKPYGTADLDVTGDFQTVYNIIDVDISDANFIIIMYYHGLWYIIGTTCPSA